MRKWISIHIVWGVFLFIAINKQTVAFASPVFDPPKQDDLSGPLCHALDVVFLIDQSSSMSGSDGSTPSDPTKQREFAPKAMIDLLAALSLDRCPGVIHRISVISYGTEAHIDLSLSDIKPDSLEDLKNKITAKDLLKTDPISAFKKAVDVLNNAAIGDGIRKRVIIAITDGQPCVEKLGCKSLKDNAMDVVAYAEAMNDQVTTELPFANKILLKREQCLAILREGFTEEKDIPPESINTCLEQYKIEEEVETYQNSIYIWNLLLKPDNPYPKGVRVIYEQMSEDHAGQVIDLSQNRNEIPTTFRKILEQLIGVKATRLECGNFVVNPYLKRAIFDFYKFDEQIQVKLSYIDTEGVRYEISGGQQSYPKGFNPKYDKLGANERYTFDAPYPGIWQLESEKCDSFDAFYESVLINPSGYQPNLPDKVFQYNRPPYYDIDNPIYLEYTMRNQDTSTVVQNPQFPIDLQLMLSTPDGGQHVYLMEWYSDMQYFQAKEPLRLPLTGTYTLTINGSTREHEGKLTVTGNTHEEIFDSTRELFHHEATFDVLPVNPLKPFIIAILSPTPGGQLRPCHNALCTDHPNSIPIRVQIIDEQGQPLAKLEQIFANVDETLVAIATTASGNQSQPVVLKPHPDISGLYVGEIIGLDINGDVTLSVQLKGDVLDGYKPANKQIEVNFNRVSVIPFAIDALSPTDDIPQTVHGTLLEGQWPLPVHPISIKAQIVDHSGQPLTELESVFADVNKTLRAVVTTDSGNQSELVILKPDPFTTGQFTGEVTNLTVEGKHHLIIELQGDPLGYYQPFKRKDEVDFSRVDTIWTRSGTYYALSGMLLVSLVFIVYYAHIRNRQVVGILYFTNGRKSLKEFRVYRSKKRTVISSRKLLNCPQFNLKELKIEKSESPKWVYVNYKMLDNNKKGGMYLKDGIPKSYNDKIIFQMCYKCV